MIEQVSETELRIRKMPIREESLKPLSDRDRDRFLQLLDVPPEANAALREAAASYLESGGPRNDSEPNPWLEFAGIFKDDPWIDDWMQSMHEYRQQAEDDPNR